MDMIPTFDIRPWPSRGDPNLLARFEGVATSTLGHWRLWGCCDRRLRPLVPGHSARGFAVTLALPGPDSALLHRAVSELRAGDILLIDRLGDDSHACLGGVTARAAKLRGAAGIVVDGPCTDEAEIRATGLPVWCAGTSPRTTKPLGLGGRLNAPVSIGGVVAHPGDVVLCDDSGVIIMAPGEAKADAERAQGRAGREAEMLAGLEAGARLDDVSGATLLMPRHGCK